MQLDPAEANNLGAVQGAVNQLRNCLDAWVNHGDRYGYSVVSDAGGAGWSVVLTINQAVQITIPEAKPAA